MARGLNNWTFADVKSFLSEHGFRYSYTKGSHYFYVGAHDNKARQVCVPLHGSKALHPKVMKSIIRQSGISQDKWLEDQNN